MNYEEAKRQYREARLVMLKMLDDAARLGKLTQREHDMLYMRAIEYKTLEEVGKKFGVTRERIRQIEAKAEVGFRLSAQ